MEFNFAEKYRAASNRLILLDYDGTLVDYKPMPAQALPEPHVLNMLYEITWRSATKLVIVTGRAANDIDRLIGHLGVDIIAEHGAEIKMDGVWITQVEKDVSWKNKVLPLFDKISATCPNSFSEEKNFSVAWHYRNSRTEDGKIHSRVLINVLEIFIQAYDLEIFDGNMLVEVITKKTNKGRAIQDLIGKTNYDFILCMGDDVTDEYMFKFLSDNPNAHTVKVGEQETAAKYRVNTVEQAIRILEKIAT